MQIFEGKSIRRVRHTGAADRRGGIFPAEEFRGDIGLHALHETGTEQCPAEFRASFDQHLVDAARVERREQGAEVNVLAGKGEDFTARGKLGFVSGCIAHTAGK